MRVLLLAMVLSVFMYSQDRKLSKLLQKAEGETLNVWIYLTDKEEKASFGHLSEKQKALRANKKVDIKDAPLTRAYVNEIENNVLRLRHKLKWFNAITATVNKDQIAKIAALPYVLKIDIVRKLKRKMVLNYEEESPLVRNKDQASIDYGSSAPQNNLINIPQVHDLGYTGKGVLLGVFDGGFNNLNHQALSPLDIQNTYDFVSNDTDLSDTGYPSGEGNHGTQTLSSMAGNKPGQLVGPAFGASFILAKTEYGPTETTQEEDNYAAALEWAEGQGVWIVSSSLGYRDFDNSSDSYSWQDFDGNTAISTKAADIAASKGILVITSAGNNGNGSNNTFGAPADGDSVLAVGATNSSGVRSSFSSVGPTADGRIKPDVMAQGSSVRVASPTNDAGYQNVNGTSFSCPITAGSAALLFEANPLATNMEIFYVLRNTANNASSPNNLNGYGVINVLAALNNIKLINHTAVTTATVGSAIQITSSVKNTYVSRMTSFQLKYKASSASSYSTVNLSQTGSSGGFTNYSANIPSQSSAGTLNYYIVASNGSRSATMPPNFESNPYSINVSGGTGGSNNFEPNDSFAAAKSININTTTKSYIQSNGDEDYFKFTVASAGNLKVELKNFPGDYDIYLYNNSQTELARGYTTNDPEIIDYTATGAATFFVRVDGYNAAFSTTDDYELTITFTASSTTATWHTSSVNIQTAHPYTNNFNNTYTYSKPGAQRVAIYFAQFETELNYDYVHIKDGANVTKASHHGTKAAFWAILDGDVIKANIVTDGSVTKYGYRITSVSYYSATPLANGLAVKNDNSKVEVHLNETSKSPAPDPFAKKEILPESFEIDAHSAYPNPFNPITTIKYNQVETGFVQVEIINLLGQVVNTLFTGELEGGKSAEFKWNATNSNGQKVSSGIYFYRIKSLNKVLTNKLVLMK
jgi:serine protease AprX